MLKERVFHSILALGVGMVFCLKLPPDFWNTYFWSLYPNSLNNIRSKKDPVFVTITISFISLS